MPSKAAKSGAKHAVVCTEIIKGSASWGGVPPAIESKFLGEKRQRREDFWRPLGDAALGVVFPQQFIILGKKWNESIAKAGTQGDEASDFDRRIQRFRSCINPLSENHPIPPTGGGSTNAKRLMSPFP